MQNRIVGRLIAVLPIAASVVLGCSSSRHEATSSSSELIEGYEPVLINARIEKSSAQIRLESTIREECKGRKTILDIRLGNNTPDTSVSFSAVAHGYRNQETISVQITRIGYFTAIRESEKQIPFDGKYPGVTGSAIEVVSVTLDALEGSSFDGTNIWAEFQCGEADRSDPGVDPSTGEAQDPSQISCLDLAALKRASVPMCEFNGNGACDGKGARTNDCEHCCQAVAAGVTAPL